MSTQDRKKMPPMAVVKERFEIVNGQLAYKKNAKGTRRANRGKVVTNDRQADYPRVCFKGYGNYRVHRVLWYLATGQEPYMLDHEDGNSRINELANLQVTNEVRNTRKAKRQSRNTSGRVGVYWSKTANKWVAQIAVNRKNRSLGYFEEFEDACMARRQAEDSTFGQDVPVDRPSIG